MSSISANHSGGIGLPGSLAVAFVVLKLCGVITWPWIWVLSPLWIGLVIMLVLLGIGAGLMGLAALLDRGSR